MERIQTMSITKINDEGSEFDDAGANLRRFKNRDDTMRWAIMARVQVVMAKDEGVTIPLDIIFGQYYLCMCY